jgi:hypothetical protein
MVYRVVNGDSLIELTTYQIINEIRKGNCQGLHLPSFRASTRISKLFLNGFEAKEIISTAQILKVK